MASREVRVWTCPVCDTRIVGCRQISKHEGLLKNGFCHARAPGQPPVAIIGAPEPAIIMGPAPNTAPEPMLARRSQMFGTRDVRRVHQMPATTNTMLVTRDMELVQDEWNHYLLQVGNLFARKFWVFFLSIHDQATVAIDAALAGVKKAFLADKDDKMFVSSKRQMLKRIQTKVPPFFRNITHCVTIDLSPCGVQEKLKFRFLDPVWAWIVAANKLPPEELHFFPQQQCDSTGARMYGGGVQYGECFAEAFRTCPQDTFPMLFNVHWDGTSAHGLPATPIAVGVVNFNGQSADAHTCVGYMPTTSVVLSTGDATNVKFYIRQKCVGAILSVMETAARTGVTCRIGKDVLTLFPRLIAMTLDQPEAQLYFGQQNGQSCWHCKRRKGRSAHRKSSPQEGSVINLLYNVVENVDLSEDVVQLAKQKLTRYGFNPKRRCLLTQICKQLLIRLPDRDDVFPSVAFRDVMHAAVIFFHRQIYEMFVIIRFRPKAELRRVVDDRL